MIETTGLLVTAAGGTLALVSLRIAAATAAELPRAIRETQARQRRLHPHPEEEREEGRRLCAAYKERRRREVEELDARFERFRHTADTVEMTDARPVEAV